MKKICLLMVLLSLHAIAQDKPFKVISCYSQGEGWIDILINSKDHNDQMLRVYSQAGLGPNSLEASYLSIGKKNSFSLAQNGDIDLIANYTDGIKLTIESSQAILSSNNNSHLTHYRNCIVK